LPASATSSRLSAPRHLRLCFEARGVYIKIRRHLEGWIVANTEVLQALQVLTVEWERSREERSMECTAKPAYRCSFCGKAQHEAGLLIINAEQDGASRDYICRGREALCDEMLAEQRQQAARK